MMKQMMALILALLLAISFASCGKEEKKENNGTSDDVEVRVAALGGSTGVGMAKLMDDGNYKVDIIAEPNEVVAGIKTGKYDIAALPVNVAAKLYKMTDGGVQVVALNTLGVLHVLENGEQTIHAVEDLKGKTIYTTGEGATPQYILEYILEMNGLVVGTDVNVVYEATADAAVAAIANGTTTICMLPEPKATAVTKQIDTVKRVLDMTEEWNKVCDTDVVQGCLIASKEFAEDHKGALDAFLKEYKESVEYIAGDPEAGSLLVEKTGIIARLPLPSLPFPDAIWCTLTVRK